jgi:hypothetical protein
MRWTTFSELAWRKSRNSMTTVAQAAAHLSRLIEQGFGHYSLKLGTRGLASLRPEGRELDLCLPDHCAETAQDGRKVAYLRACDGDL